MIVFGSPAELSGHVGRTLGVSEWMTVDQTRINDFAAITGDRHWIHTDPQRAGETSFGGTIAHGFLTLALIVPLADQVMQVDGARMTINYGLNRVRFPHPVQAGARIRATVGLSSVDPVEDGVEALRDIVIEVEESSRPACVAQSVVRYLH